MVIKMNEIPGLEESFKNHNVIYMITFDKEGESHSRPMTNYNKDPYGLLWFPTFRDTQKVKDIEENPEVRILFPSGDSDFFFEIKGTASFASRAEVQQKWEWWYLFWHPNQHDKFWIDRSSDHPDRIIINVEPEEAKLIHRDRIDYVDRPYRTVRVREALERRK